MKNQHTKAVFLDRDGVVNKLVVINGERTSPKSLDQFEIFPNLSQVLSKIREQYLIIIITNQPDIARKKLSVTELEKMHAKLREQIEIDDLYVCEHDDVDNCLCRKPKPGLIINAAKKWNIDLMNSIIVGDSWRDMLAGEKVGLTKYYVDPCKNDSHNNKIQFKYDHRVKNLKDAGKAIYENF